ncbi:MAG: ferredoxin-type protein NapF [Candidatus Electrothrix sp. AR3]|nr:ferredoxin-type protein NapF [Candidatus Electrothrix sp. AR3]
MNLAALFADKFFSYLLKEDTQKSISSPLPSLLPPWSLAALDFNSLCTGCGECVTACTEGIIIQQKNDKPIVDFTNGFCIFCGDCAQACPTEALQFSSETPPWEITASVHENCLLAKQVLCRTCGEQCDQEAIIYHRTVDEGQLPQIISEKCNGCGACYSTCPTEAIFFKQRASQKKTQGEE